MPMVVIGRGEDSIGFGYEKIPGKKRPCIAIKNGYGGVILGYFQDDEHAQMFMDTVEKFCSLICGKEIQDGTADN